jgi:hypothetical protein
MKTLTSLLAGATLMAFVPGAAIADDSDMSFAVHDIIVTSNIPAINVSVRNLSPSPFPAMRNLRVTSPTPVLNVAGQVWCKTFQNAHTRADAAQVVFGDAALVSTPDGADIMPIGTWSPSPVVQLGANETLRNFNINAAFEFPDHWNGGIAFGFNPVREVEKRMEQFVQNGVGTEADFLRMDDVFETTIKVNAVGWCEYDSQNLSNKRYAGYRQIDVPVHIFYHGDPDIEDQVTAVGSRGTIQAPPPPPGPSYAPSSGRRGRDAAPPPRRAPPSGSGGTRRPDREREPAEARSDAYIAIPDIDGEGSEGLILPAVQHQQEPVETRRDGDRRRTDDRERPGLGDTIAREAARAAIGALLGSGRSTREARPPARPGRPR